MNGFNRLALADGQLFLREKAALLGVFGLPVALVIGFGLIPGFGDPQKGLSDQIGTEYIAALGVAIVMATLGLTGVPMVLGQYRQRGILRRLAVTPAARGAAGIGWLLFFPNMFLAGIYFPTEEMSSTMRQVGNFTPLGSALYAVRDSWMGIDPRPEYLGIMAAWALVAGAVAVRFFRWEQA